jgi:PmbA protein
MTDLDFALSQRLLERVGAAGFDAAEVLLTQRKVTEMQIDAGDISLLRDTENIALTLRGIAGGRYATVHLNQLDDDSVRIGVEQLQQAAQAAPVDPARAFAPPQDVEAHDDGPAEAALGPMHDRVEGFAAAVRQRFPDVKLEQAMLQFERTRALRANTLGLQLDTRQAGYDAQAMFSAERGEKRSSFNYGGGSARDLDRALFDWGGLGRLIESSSRELEHVAFDGKFVGSLVLTPECVFSLLDPWLAHLSDERLIAGTSRLRESIGKPVCSPLLTLRIDPASPRFARREFTTGDGYRSLPSTLIEAGVLRSFMLSDYGARKTGLPRAVNGGRHRVVEPGTTPLAALIEAVPKGLLMGRFSGGGPAANGDFSGVAKNSYLIEGGRVGPSVSEVMVSGNLFEMMHAIRAVSAETVNDGNTEVPWIRVDGITVAGK